DCQSRGWLLESTRGLCCRGGPCGRPPAGSQRAPTRGAPTRTDPSRPTRSIGNRQIVLVALERAGDLVLQGGADLGVVVAGQLADESGSRRAGAAVPAAAARGEREGREREEREASDRSSGGHGVSLRFVPR